MNKLVSKNPILRFKEGRKIEKEPWAGYYTVGNWPKTAKKEVVNNTKGITPAELAKFNRKYLYNQIASTYGETSPSFPAFIQDARFGDYLNPWLSTRGTKYQSGFVHDLEEGNLAWQPKKVKVPYISTLKSQNNLSTQDVNIQSNSPAQDINTQNILPKTTEPLTQSKSNFLNKKLGSQKFTKGKSRKTSITPSIFAGHRIGRTGGLNYNINDADKLQLIGTGQFTESDFTNARATLLALNRYFANSGLGSVNVDNVWGDLSRAALALALSKSKGLTPLNNETTVVKTPIVPTYTPSTTPINLEIANLKLNANVPQQTYDRTGIREYLRSKGLNPYSFSGALRRALRMVMNGQGTDNDKLLVRGMNIFKLGGLLLPSRNPVIRFRNRNFR